jgi:hypothetical protein
VAGCPAQAVLQAALYMMLRHYIRVSAETLLML